MAQPPGISPAAWSHDGGGTGVLILHGFTGTVSETRPLGEHLATLGMGVRCPLLPGHGTHVKELTRCSHADWLTAVRKALAELRAHHPRTFVVGMSLGSLLALRLAEEDARGDAPHLAGVVALSPALKVRTPLLPLTVLARHVLDYDPAPPVDDSVDPTQRDRNWCYDRTPLWGAAEVWRLQRLVRGSLGAVTQPLLAVQGRFDRAISDDAGALLMAAVSSTDKELVWLEHSGHNVLLDGQRAALNARIGEWIVGRSSTSP